MFRLKSLPIIIFIVLTSFFFSGNTPPEEGMYPLSELSKLDLKKAGLKIDVKELYNPNGVSLIDAFVRIGGCSGSFVSNEGLILTNHHCAYDYVQQASTLEKNYLRDGFHAKSKEEEIPAVGLTCLINESYEDVSDKILTALEKGVDVSDRQKILREKIREIVKEVEENEPGIKAEVSEMFVGQTYVLFKYRVIKDIRLVYIPPEAIGNFGAESDNWVWPRHTGDFSFVRAYVAPDGSPADYSKDNIPFTPKKYLKINPAGVTEEDFVFIVGYPGRTFRHYPSAFISYHEEIFLPYRQQLYNWLINSYKELGEKNELLAFNVLTRIKRLANTEKNFSGKMLGMRRLSLVEKKKNEEKLLLEFINSDATLKAEFGNTLNEINIAYDEIKSNAYVTLMQSELRINVTPIRIAMLLADYKKELLKPEESRSTIFTAKGKKELEARINQLFESYLFEADIISFKKIAEDAFDKLDFKSKSFISDLFEISEKKEISNKIENIFSSTKLLNEKYFGELINKTSSELENFNDPLLSFTERLDSLYEPTRKANEVANGKLNLLLPKWMDVKKLWQKKNFIPDANSTMRLTYGYVRGYTPADATYYSPITTIKGMIEKSFYGGDYALPNRVKELYEQKQFGKFAHPKLKDVPIAILYNMDTTGGNSGSPILNAYGELVGVNFDRAFEATINDYAWSEDYSRSIGVDIRFILWVTSVYSGANNLLEEMGVN